MAHGTVVGDACAATRGVAAVVASEAAWGTVVPDIVRMRAPPNIHGREHVAAVDSHQGIGRRLNLRLLAVPDRRVLGAIESD